ncbi:MAG: potassium channel family protein [Caulobacterales bacterium]
MIPDLALSTVMVVLTVTIHFFGLVVLLRILRARGNRFRAHESVIGQGGLILFVVLGLFIIHAVEIWAYAFVYLAIGALADLETALYFSTVTFASLGYGDVVLEREWRVFGAIEAANGLILFAWSTAFLLSVMARLKALEHDWLDPG